MTPANHSIHAEVFAMHHPARRPPRRSTVVLAALLLASAAACGKKDAAEDAAPGTATTAAAAVSVTDVSVGKSVDADKRVTDESDDFAPADVIYASVATTGAASNANLTARWTFEDGQTVDSTTQVISPTGPAATEFHISKPGGLPKGKYKVQVMLNGAPAGTEEFEVK